MDAHNMHAFCMLLQLIFVYSACGSVYIYLRNDAYK